MAFEYRGKRPEPAWRARWDAVIVAGSLAPAVLWGIVIANLVHGIPLHADHEFTGGLLDLLHPYALVGGITTLTLFVTHGASFLALKTTGEIRDRAQALARATGPIAATLTAAFLAWTMTIRGGAASAGLAVAATVALLAGLAATRVRRDGLAFLGTASAIGLTVAALFTGLYPDVLPSTLDPAGGLTVHNAAAGPYSLKIMTWVAVAAAPLVLLYQGWTYWVFRRRIGVHHIPE